MTIAPHNKQRELFYLAPILNAINTASARNAYGTAAQEIICRTLNLNPIPINGNFDVCFDAEKDGQFYEIKSVRSTGKIVIYDWRMKKEQNTCPSLVYLILVHKLKAARLDILQLMAKSELSIVQISAKTIHKMAVLSTLRKHKNYQQRRNGYSRKGYKDGYYNLALKPVIQHASISITLPNPFGGPKIKFLSCPNNICHEKHTHI